MSSIKHFHKNQKLKRASGTLHGTLDTLEPELDEATFKSRKEKGDLKESDYSSRTRITRLEDALKQGYLELVELDEPVNLEDYLLDNNVYRAHRDIEEDGTKTGSLD